MTQPVSSESSICNEVMAQAETQPFITFSSLKEKLGISSGKCGCPRKDNNGTCMNPLRGKNMQAIDRHIEMLRRYTESSDSLTEDLQKLAELVHCSVHSPSKWHVKRVAHWRAQCIFPTGDQGMPPPTIGELVQKLLSPTSRPCTVCKNSVGGQKIEHAVMTVRELEKPDVLFDQQVRDYAIDILVYTRFCDSHTDTHGVLKRAFQSGIASLIQSISPTGLTPIPNSEKESAISHAYRDGVAPRRCWPRAFDTKLFVTELPKDRPANRQACYKDLRRVLTKPMDKKEAADGFVYLYQASNNDSFVKIGFTGKEKVQDRIDEWIFDCNRAATLVYPAGPVLTKRIPYAKRVEALCHAELAYTRELVDCRACLATHTEWFRISTSQAVKTIQKWTTWIETSPYPSGYLKPDLVSKTRDMDALLDAIAHAQEAVDTLSSLPVPPLLSRLPDEHNRKVHPLVVVPKVDVKLHDLATPDKEVEQGLLGGGPEQKSNVKFDELGLTGATALSNSEEVNLLFPAEKPLTQTIVKKDARSGRSTEPWEVDNALEGEIQSLLKTESLPLRLATAKEIFQPPATESSLEMQAVAA